MQFIEKIKQKINPTDRIRRFRIRIALILGLIVIVLLVALTSDIVEQYNMNHDNIAQFVPGEAVLYVHGNMMTASAVTDQLAEFFEYHPVLATKVTQFITDAYPFFAQLRQLPVQEFGVALLPQGSGVVVQTYVFLQMSSQAQIEQVAAWRSQGLYVHEYDSVVVIAPTSGMLLGEQSLQEVYSEKNQSPANTWYAFVRYNQLTKLLDDAAVFTDLVRAVALFGDQQQWGLLTAQTRDGTLVLSESFAPLAQPMVRVSSAWRLFAHPAETVYEGAVLVSDLKEYLDSDKTSSLLLQSRFKQLFENIFARYDVNIMEQIVPNITDRVRFLYKNNKTEPEVVIQVTPTVDFDMRVVQQGLRQAASFEAPQPVERLLPDGTTYTELVAIPTDDIIANISNPRPDLTRITVSRNNLVFPWSAVFFKEQLYLTNSANLLQNVIAGTEQTTLSDSSNPCLNLSDQYLYATIPLVIAQATGLHEVVWFEVNDQATMCFK